jgi:glycosyltransferase involved in cell wall biosynthesis
VFHTVLASPSTSAQAQAFAGPLAAVADETRFWHEGKTSIDRFLRLRHLASRLPISVASDISAAGQRAVATLLAERPSVAVFDFIHSAVLLPAATDVPTVMFTHNVEAEIFARHVKVASGPLKRALWNGQYQKMVDFERTALARFDAIVAVSERDKAMFFDHYAVGNVATIPTGVDADHLRFSEPTAAQRVVFCGSMDWLPNIDGVDFFLTDVWPLIRARLPNATMTVIGRTPPKWLVAKAKALDERWVFTGYVDDVRPHAQGAAAFVIPLRVGGGTRIKAFEAMALGCPVVSTTIGIEGLPLTEGQHYLRADSAAETAAAVVRLIEDEALRRRIAATARAYVEENFSFRVAAKVFEDICMRAARLS